MSSNTSSTSSSEWAEVVPTLVYLEAIPFDKFDYEIRYPFRHTGHFHRVARKGLVYQKLHATLGLFVSLAEVQQEARVIGSI